MTPKNETPSEKHLREIKQILGIVLILGGAWLMGHTFGVW